jgi:hypothetical protein
MAASRVPRQPDKHAGETRTETEQLMEVQNMKLSVCEDDNSDNTSQTT